MNPSPWFVVLARFGPLDISWISSLETKQPKPLPKAPFSCEAREKGRTTQTKKREEEQGFSGGGKKFKEKWEKNFRYTIL